MSKQCTLTHPLFFYQVNDIIHNRAGVGLIFRPGISCLRPAHLVFCFFCICTGLFGAAFVLSIILFFYLLYFACIIPTTRFSFFFFWARCHCQGSQKISHLVTSLLFQMLHLRLPRYPPCLSPYLFFRCVQSCADLLFYVVCVLCLPVLQFSAGLPVFPPRGGFCSFLFHFFIKRKTILPATWVLASSLLAHPDRTDQPQWGLSGRRACAVHLSLLSLANLVSQKRGKDGVMIIKPGQFEHQDTDQLTWVLSVDNCG